MWFLKSVSTSLMTDERLLYLGDLIPVNPLSKHAKMCIYDKME